MLVCFVPLPVSSQFAQAPGLDSPIPWARLPIISPVPGVDPRRQNDKQIIGDALGIRLVERPQMRQLLLGFGVLAELDSMFGEAMAQAIHLVGRQTVGKVRIVARIHHLGQVHHGVARHGKSNSGLLIAKSFDPGYYQRAGVEDCGQSPQPGLIVVLRAEETQRRVGKMALQHLGGPLPKRRSNSAAVGGEPARASSREISISRRENAE